MTKKADKYLFNKLADFFIDKARKCETDNWIFFWSLLMARICLKLFTAHYKTKLALKIAKINTVYYFRLVWAMMKAIPMMCRDTVTRFSRTRRMAKKVFYKENSGWLWKKCFKDSLYAWGYWAANFWPPIAMKKIKGV